MELVNMLIILFFELLVMVFSEVLCQNHKSSSSKPPSQSFAPSNSSRDGRNLLHWIHSFTNPETDPYLAKVNSACLDGDLAECFKAKALTNLDEYFGKESYTLNENVCIVRMPKEHVSRIYQEPFEFSEGARAEEPEWEQFVKFVSRKVERFLKSAAVEVEFSDDVTENGRYSPRFIDEIASELEAIEDKKAGKPIDHKPMKLLLPLLIILKLFKLKLLLFLPLILGLASFKKFLGFLAIVIPGLIGFFRLCKPDLHHNYGSFGHSSFYHRPPHQYVSAIRPDHPLYTHELRATESPDVIQYLQDNYGAGGSSPHYYAKHSADKPNSSPSMAFREDPQNLAYNGYQQSKK